jgi:hypothetical protein
MPGVIRDLTAVRPSLMSARTTALLLAPVWAGLLVGAIVRRPLDGLLVALGAYIVLFGGGQPGRARLRIHLFATAGLLTCIALGMSVVGSAWSVLLAYAGVALIAAVLTAKWFDPGPPGPYFFVLMVGAGTLLTPVGNPARVVPVVAVGCVLAIAVAQVDSRLEKYSPRPASSPAGVGSGLQLARLLAALVPAVAISQWRGDPHPFWVVLVVVLVVSYPGNERVLTARAVARLLGTLLGIALFLPVARLHLGTIGFTVWLCLLIWPVARLTTRNYLAGSILITVLALSMTVPLAAAESPASLALDRAVDTLLAVALSILALWTVRARSQPGRAAPDGRGYDS